MKTGSIWLKILILKRIRTRISSRRMPAQRLLPMNLQLMESDAKWIVYGEFLGDQKVSILRLSLNPGSKTTFRPDSPALFHTNGGSGRVGKLEVKYHQNMVLGEIYPEIGFITQSALSNGGVEIENTGSEPLVLTFDFPQNAHSQIPGVS